MPLGGAILLGLDHWYTAFAALETLSTSTALPLLGIADPDPQRRAFVHEKHPAVPVTADFQEGITLPGAAVALICASTDQAPALAIRALESGLHVICVKPAARTLAELDTVLAAAESAGRFFGSFEGMQRLHPRALICRDLIAAGAIGTPLSYHQRGHGGLPAPWPGHSGDPRAGGGSWWIQADRVPGGAWIDHAIYAVDFARFVFAPAASVQLVGSVIGRRAAPPSLSLEDYGIALLELRRDATPPAPAPTPVSLVIEDTWAAEPGGGSGRQEILGAHGTLRLEGSDWVVSRDAAETRHAIPDGPFFPFDTLASLLETGQSLPFGPADARENLAICLEVYRR